MLGLSANMNTLIDMNYFNNALIMGGGNEIITSKNEKLFKNSYKNC